MNDHENPSAPSGTDRWIPASQYGLYKEGVLVGARGIELVGDAYPGEAKSVLLPWEHVRSVTANSAFFFSALAGGWPWELVVDVSVRPEHAPSASPLWVQVRRRGDAVRVRINVGDHSQGALLSAIRELRPR